MTAYETFIDYVALKNHFSLDSYDYIKYCGKVNVSVENYNNRNDRYHFERLSKNPDAHDILVAHMSHNPDLWIGDVSEKSDIYKNWTKTRQSLQYQFSEELKIIKFPDDLKCDGGYPVLLKKYQQGKVSRETMIILNSIINYAPYWNTKIQDDYVWPKINFKFKKFSSFLKFDLTKYKVLLDNHISNTNI